MARLYNSDAICPIVQPHFRRQRYNKTSCLSRVLRKFFLAENQYFTNVSLTISLVIVNFKVVISQEFGRWGDDTMRGFVGLSHCGSPTGVSLDPIPLALGPKQKKDQFGPNNLSVKLLFLRREIRCGFQAVLWKKQSTFGKEFFVIFAACIFGCTAFFFYRVIAFCLVKGI